MVELDDVRSEGGDSGSQLLDVVVWEWGSDFLGHSSKNHPVVLGKSWGREAASGSLGSSIDVDVGSDLLKVAGSGEDEVGVEGSLITSMSLVDNEGILWDLLMSELVIAKEVDDLGGLQVRWALGGDTELELINSCRVAVENIESVPVVLSTQKIGSLLQFIDGVHDTLSILSLEGQGADHNHWEIGRSQSLAEWVRSIGQILQSLGRISEVGVVVWELWG